jgi:hypothetical protein
VILLALLPATIQETVCFLETKPYFLSLLTFGQNYNIMNTVKTIRTYLGLTLVEVDANYLILDTFKNNKILGFLVTDKTLLIDGINIWLYYVNNINTNLDGLLNVSPLVINNALFIKQLNNLPLNDLSLALFLEQHN